MTTHHIVDVIFRAAVWRSMHGLGLLAALTLAVAAAAIGLYLNRR